MTSSSETSRLTTGILLMMLAMLSIPAVDGLAKYLSAGYSPLFIGWARYAVATVYLELIGAAIGYYFFGEVPSIFTVMGAGLIIAAGSFC
jgi:drug/metabolite transporter (DMT)-like permease